MATATDFYHFPYQVKVVDTTAAGDVFNGVLAESLVAGNDIKTAIASANAAGALAVTVPGAQTAAPTRKAMLDFMQSHENEAKNIGRAYIARC